LTRRLGRRHRELVLRAGQAALWRVLSGVAIGGACCEGGAGSFEQADRGCRAGSGAALALCPGVRREAGAVELV
jgi:hypothetical protein